MKRLVSVLLFGLLSVGIVSMATAETGTFTANGSFTVNSAAPTGTMPKAMSWIKADRARVDSANAALRRVEAKLDKVDGQQVMLMTALPTNTSQVGNYLRRLDPWLKWFLVLAIIALIAAIIALLVSIFRPRTVESRVVVELPKPSDPPPAKVTSEPTPSAAPSQPAGSPGAASGITWRDITVGSRVRIKTTGAEGVVTKMPNEAGLVEVTTNDTVVTLVKLMEIELLATPAKTATSITERVSSDDEIVVRVPASAQDVLVLVARGGVVDGLARQVNDLQGKATRPKAAKPTKAPKSKKPAPARSAKKKR